MSLRSPVLRGEPAGRIPTELQPPQEHRARGLRLLTTGGWYILPAIGIVLVWWGIASAVGLPGLFPGPASTVSRFWGLLRERVLINAMWISIVRIVAGFMMGSLLGVLLGFAMGTSRAARAILGPYIHFLRFVPPIVWFPAILLWFGAGELGKIVLIAYTSAFVVAINTMVGVAGVPQNKLRMARTFGADPWTLTIRIRLPSAAPDIFTGMRVAMGNSIATIVAAEMLASTRGLGYLLVSGQNLLNPTETFSAMFCLGLIGIVADIGFRQLIRRYGARFYEHGMT